MLKHKLFTRRAKRAEFFHITVGKIAKFELNFNHSVNFFS